MTDHDTQDATAVRPRVELSIHRLRASTDEEVLAALAARAFEAGFVRESFAEALLTRERAYPTGLPTAIPVAIPHADVEHVLRPGLGIAVLDEPVAFGEMGGESGTVAARVVVVILVTEPHAQVELLVSLIDVFQREGWFASLEAAKDESELVDAFAALLAPAAG